VHGPANTRPGRRGGFVHRARPLLWITLAGALLLAAVPAAEAHRVLDQYGRVGATALPSSGTCKYRVGGRLEVGSNGPSVTGANLRRRRRDVTFARYKVYLVSGNSIEGQTGWSGWIRVSDRAWSGWSGYTYFNGDWRYQYHLDFFFEWWKGGRRRGWRDYRMESFLQWDQYNLGPFGPVGACVAYGRV
jgi:hypothetical protein